MQPGLLRSGTLSRDRARQNRSILSAESADAHDRPVRQVRTGQSIEDRGAVHPHHRAGHGEGQHRTRTFDSDHLSCHLSFIVSRVCRDDGPRRRGGRRRWRSGKRFRLAGMAAADRQGRNGRAQQSLQRNPDVRQAYRDEQRSCQCEKAEILRESSCLHSGRPRNGSHTTRSGTLPSGSMCRGLVADM